MEPTRPRLCGRTALLEVFPWSLRAPGPPAVWSATKPATTTGSAASGSPPVKGQYFENVSPVNGQVVHRGRPVHRRGCRSGAGRRPRGRAGLGQDLAPERAVILNKIADRIEQNLEKIAVAETWDNGKPVRETLNADIPLAIDHFRYFAGAIRAQEGSLSQIDEDTVAYHFHEPLGVVGQIIPWNFPILMAVWKLAPALAAGNAVVLKPAEQTPASIMLLMDIIGDLLPPGVLNIVNGFGVECGKPLASSNRIRKIAFTGETTTGRLIMQYASENLIPVTLELGGKIPNVFFADVGPSETPSTTRRSRASTCSPSTRARSAPARPGR